MLFCSFDSSFAQCSFALLTTLLHNALLLFWQLFCTMLFCSFDSSFAQCSFALLTALFAQCSFALLTALLHRRTIGHLWKCFQLERWLRNNKFFVCFFKKIIYKKRNTKKKSPIVRLLKIMSETRGWKKIKFYCKFKTVWVIPYKGALILHVFCS